MNFSNLDAAFADLAIRLEKAMETQAVPVFKGIVMEAAHALVEGDYRYAGTPEWSGNAAANWWPTSDSPATNFEQFFSDPPYPDPEGPSKFSAKNPREEAVDESIGRVQEFLENLRGLPTHIFLTNTAPYLQEFEPYGSGRQFRLENLYPLSAMRAATFLQARVNAATSEQMTTWKQGF